MEIRYKEYLSKLNEVDNLYKKNVKFRKAVRETTLEVVSDKMKEDMDDSIDEACLYLIEELSFVLASPKIYGSKSAKYLYHKNWKIFEDLIEGKFDKKRNNFELIVTGI